MNRSTSVKKRRGELLGYTQSKVSRLECGEGLHNLYNLLVLSDVYDVPLKELLFGKDIKEDGIMGKEHRKEVHSTYTEVCKIATPEPGEGVILVDVAAWFPYINVDVLEIEAALWGIGCFAGYEHYISADQQAETVLNRRYANKAYVTLSSKRGRSVCKEGCPITGPVDELNGYAFLEIDIGIKGTAEPVVLPFIVPINVNLTEERPLSRLSFRVCFLEDEAIAPGVSMDVNGKIYDTREETESDASSHLREPLHAFKTSLPGREGIVLSPVNEEVDLIKSVCDDRYCFSLNAEELI